MLMHFIQVDSFTQRDNKVIIVNVTLIAINKHSIPYFL